MAVIKKSLVGSAPSSKSTKSDASAPAASNLKPKSFSLAPKKNSLAPKKNSLMPKAYRF